MGNAYLEEQLKAFRLALEVLDGAETIAEAKKGLETMCAGIEARLKKKQKRIEFWLMPERRGATITQGDWELQAQENRYITNLEIGVWRSTQTGAILILWRSENGEWLGRLYPGADPMELLRSLPIPREFADELVRQIAVAL